MTEIKEGKIVINKAGHQVFYRLFGSGRETLVGLHGGPGADHRYLMRLGELAGGNLQVLLYDQLGSRLSDRPDDASLWTVPRFVEELETIRHSLNLDRMHLLGQSWGGILALQFALDHPEGVKSLILSNIGASTAEIVRGMNQRRLELPAEVYRQMLKYEGAGDYQHPEYIKQVNQFYARFLRRATPFDPETSLTELEALILPLMDDLGPAYFAMWGPNEFVCTGSLLDWDVTERLDEIDAPTLILCGWYDEVVPEVQRVMAERIPNNEFIIFGNSSHVIILEKGADAYLGVIKNFIERVAIA